MEHKRNRRFSFAAINARGTRLALEATAHKLAPRIKAGTPVRSGATAESTHVETGHRSASGDRPAVRIVQTGGGTKEKPGAPVPTNFRTRRNYMIRAVSGGA